MDWAHCGGPILDGSTAEATRTGAVLCAGWEPGLDLADWILAPGSPAVPLTRLRRVSRCD